MRILLFIAVIFGCLSVAVHAYAQNSSSVCQPPKATKINVKPETHPVKYDYTKTLAQLQRVQSDTINPYGFHQTTQIRGLMQGSIQVRNPDVKFGYRQIDIAGNTCVWFDTITIGIVIDPTIIIAKEVAADPCTLKAVRGHELQHVKIDRQIVNKYARSMGEKVHKALESRGYAAGPVPAAQVQDMVNKMGEIIFKIVGHEQKKMVLERDERQQAFDSLDEYENVANSCPKTRRR